MYQTASQYQIATGILSHFPGLPQLLRDGAEDARPVGADTSNANEVVDMDELLTNARVRSGDYVATLATELDKLAQGLAAANAPETPTIERLVQELLYIDRRYELASRTK